jgi:hypothetical protein
MKANIKPNPAMEERVTKRVTSITYFKPVFFIGAPLAGVFVNPTYRAAHECRRPFLSLMHRPQNRFLTPFFNNPF